MKKTSSLLCAFIALLAIFSCSGERDYLECQGLSLGLKPQVFVDSFIQRGLVYDSAHSTPDNIVLKMPEGKAYSVIVATRDSAIYAVQETYRATYNDSTRFLWQRLRDDFVEKLGRNPGIPKRNEDHKIADFETSEYHLVVTLDNRSVPMLTVLYEMKDDKK